MKTLLAATALIVSAFHSLGAQSAAGEWNGTMNTPGAEVPLHFILQVKGDSLTGTIKRSTGDVPLKGRIKSDSVFFDYTILYNDSPFPLSLRGRVVRDSLTGIVDFGGGNEDSFATKRVITKPDTTKSAPPQVKGGGGGVQTSRGLAFVRGQGGGAPRAVGASRCAPPGAELAP